MSMHIPACIHFYTCMYTNVDNHAYAHIHTHFHTCVSMHVSTRMPIHMIIHASMHVCVQDCQCASHGRVNLDNGLSDVLSIRTTDGTANCTISDAHLMPPPSCVWPVCRCMCAHEFWRVKRHAYSHPRRHECRQHAGALTSKLHCRQPVPSWCVGYTCDNLGRCWQLPRQSSLCVATDYLTLIHEHLILRCTACTSLQNDRACYANAVRIPVFPTTYRHACLNMPQSFQRSSILTRLRCSQATRQATSVRMPVASCKIFSNFANTVGVPTILCFLWLCGETHVHGTPGQIS